MYKQDSSVMKKTGRARSKSRGRSPARAARTSRSSKKDAVDGKKEVVEEKVAEKKVVEKKGVEKKVEKTTTKVCLYYASCTYYF